jgi:hypothetical protein
VLLLKNKTWCYLLTADEDGDDEEEGGDDDLVVFTVMLYVNFVPQMS